MTLEKTSPLHFRYVIDGIPQELTPAQILEGACGNDVPVTPEFPVAALMDESVDPVFSDKGFDSSHIKDYMRMVSGARRRIPFSSVPSFTRFKLASALVDAVWRPGHFCFGDLSVSASWKWNAEVMGSMSAFYSSVRECADYLDDLDICMSEYDCKLTGGPCKMSFKAQLAKQMKFDGELDEGSQQICMRQGRNCPGTFVPDPQSWVVFIPFDTAEFRLGGSLLSQVAGGTRDVAPDISDAHYFIDCFEVIRELSEDGILLSGATVTDGGLLETLRRMTDEKTGVTIDVSDMARAYEESNIVRLLFSEIPGAVIQIRDMDFDYLDAELLLQDVAFFPLGHPSGRAGVRVKSSSRSGIQSILESLISREGVEGED